jgi:hypothetical protein
VLLFVFFIQKIWRVKIFFISMIFFFIGINYYFYGNKRGIIGNEWKMRRCLDLLRYS